MDKKIFELIDTFGPYQCAEALAKWCADHAPTVNDRDWRGEYELLAREFTRIANRNWNNERE